MALAAAVGADPAGEFMVGQLAAAGVDTGAVVIRPGLATGMTVALSRGSDRAIITATGAMTSLTARDLPPALIRRARHLHVSSYFLLEHSLGPGLARLLARRAGGGTRRRWIPTGTRPGAGAVTSFALCSRTPTSCCRTRPRHGTSAASPRSAPPLEC